MPLGSVPGTEKEKKKLKHNFQSTNCTGYGADNRVGRPCGESHREWQKPCDCGSRAEVQAQGRPGTGNMKRDHQDSVKD